MDYLDLELSSYELNLFEPLESSLFSYINKTQTRIGSQQLHQWLEFPLTSISEIEWRQNIVTYFIENPQISSSLRSILQGLSDLHTVHEKFKKYSEGRHGVQLNDCVKFYNDIRRTAELFSILNEESPFYFDFKKVVESSENLITLIEKAIDLQAIDGEYFINPSFSTRIFEIHEEIKQNEEEIKILCVELSARLRLSREVKVINSGSHHYLLEGNKKEIYNAMNTIDDSIVILSHKQLQVSFTVPDFKRLVKRKVDLQKELSEEEVDLVVKVIELVSSYFPVLEDLCQLIANLDSLLSLSVLVTNSHLNYTKPILNTTNHFKLENCRHPILDSEETSIGNSFTPENARTILITGPNMGGKTTFIRTIAINAILAHIGSYIPADAGEIPILDRVCARIGAGDIELEGESTFMVEMSEISKILEKATGKSLILLDEIGRGTDTREGCAIAYAITYYLTDIGALTLFATHFSELTEMFEKDKRVEVKHTEVNVGESIEMTYNIKEGAMDSSYGIEIAEMAGMPLDYIREARQIKERFFN